MSLLPVLVILGYIAFGAITLGIIIYLIVKRIRAKSEETFEDRRS